MQLTSVGTGELLRAHIIIMASRCGLMLVQTGAAELQLGFRDACLGRCMQQCSRQLLVSEDAQNRPAEQLVAL